MLEALPLTLSGWCRFARQMGVCMKGRMGLTCWLTGLLLIMAACASPAAEAGCGGVETAGAERVVNPGGHAPLAIGDSTMLLALPNLARAGYRVNARGCRGWSEGMAVLRAEKRSRRLPHLVLMALGADWSVSLRSIRRTLHLLGPRRVLALMTPLELGGWAGDDARSMRRAFKRYPQRIVLLDWVRYSRGHGEWFQPDGTHLTFSGADAFARLARRATPWAKHGEMPNRTFFPKADS